MKNKMPPPPTPTSHQAIGPVRIHKLLAQLGVGSRRSIEEWIKEGKIQINGKPAQIGQFITIKDRIHVAGQPVMLTTSDNNQIPRILIYHKPEGEICSRVSEDQKQSVYSHLPPLEQGRWVMVGRLDVNTAGLLLFTNNGELAHRLMHPSFQVKRQYAVRVLGKVTAETLARLKKGVALPEGFCQFKEIVARNTTTGANQWFTVTVTEGKYREVRQLWASQGCTVSRLIRIKYGSIELPRGLRKGKFQEMPLQRVQSLLETHEVEVE